MPLPWTGCDRVTVDRSVLADREALGSLVDDLHRRWASRTPTVIELAVDDETLAAPEADTRPGWELGAEFTFLRERLLFVVWNNAYDARHEPPRWWWDVKARRVGADPAPGRDVVLPDGTEAWIDGGPRGPIDIDDPVISYESIVSGSTIRMGSTIEPASDDLAPDQRAAVAHGSGPARVIAPAGSGKTRVLTARARHLVTTRSIEPGLVCALAYNRRAAVEMQQRLADLAGLRIRTLHSIGWEILQMARGPLTLLGERDVRRRVEALVETARRPNTDAIGPYLEALAEVRIGFRDPSEVEAGRDDVPDLARMLPRYRRRLAENREADHDEQIIGAIEALASDPDLRRHWQHQCRHLLVDEFQDVTPAYLLLIRLLASPALEVFGVGDDDQVIYGYAGADPGYLIDFDRLFPRSADHPLEVNYRCPVPVVDAARTLLPYNLRRVDKTIRPGPGAEEDPESLRVIRTREDRLATTVAELAAEWMAAGTLPADIAVLARVNSTLLPAQAALAEAGIGVQGTLGPGLLDRTVVRAALAWIRLALDPQEMGRSDLLEAIRRPSRGLNRLASDVIGRRSRLGLDRLRREGAGLDGRRRTKWMEFCDDIAAAAGAATRTDRLLDVLTGRVGLDGAAAALDAGRTRADRAAQTDDLRALRRVASFAPDPATFEPWLRRLLDGGDDPDGIQLSTVHRVKGLEWERVVVFGVDRGSMPHALSEDVEEERRVFHVALTRGRQQVVVLSDSATPSRFLTELDGSAPRPTERPPPARRRTAPPEGVRVAVGHAVRLPGGYVGTVDEVLVTGVLVRLDNGTVMAVPWGERIHTQAGSGPLVPGDPSPDPEVAARLRSWRADTARRLGVPAYIVFNDTTLDSLASLRPTTEAGLLDVPGIGPTKLEAYGDDLLAILGP